MLSTFKASRESCKAEDQANERAAYAKHKQMLSEEWVKETPMTKAATNAGSAIKRQATHLTYNDLVNRTQARLRCNLCNSPERSVRKAMLKAFPNMVSIQHDANYAYEATLSPHDHTYCIDGIIREAVRQNNALYGNTGASIRILEGFDRIKGDRYGYANK